MKTKKTPTISEEKIICSYRPHMFLIAVLPIVGLSIILFSSASIVLLLNLVETGMPTVEQLVKGFFTLCMALASVFVFILFVKMYDICIIGTQEGIYVINDRKIEPSLKTWHSLGYAYYTKNIQGHCFIVHSPKLIYSTFFYEIHKDINPMQFIHNLQGLGTSFNTQNTFQANDTT